jgi:hypothetical protein
MLTAYFKANAELPEASKYLYQDFPTHFTYLKQAKKWNVRKKGHAIGRMYFASPSSGERYYVRMLLTVVRGATSFDVLKTVNGEVCETFHEACRRRGLLQDDGEWQLCLQEASITQTGSALRSLFATMLLFCQIGDPSALWSRFKTFICDDLQRALEHKGVDPIEEGDPVDYGLYLLDQLLHRSGSGLDYFPGMPKPQKAWDHVGQNRLITEQHSYDRAEEGRKAAENCLMLNPEQWFAFDSILESALNHQGKLFFLNGPAGTGKTFVYNVVCSRLRAED